MTTAGRNQIWILFRISNRTQSIRALTLVLACLLCLSTASCLGRESKIQPDAGAASVTSGGTLATSDPTAQTSPVTPTASPAPDADADLSIPPFAERRFVYTNGLTVEHREKHVPDEWGVHDLYFPEIDGLLDATIEQNLEAMIQQTMVQQMDELVAKLQHDHDPALLEVTRVSQVSVVYNCNHVLFLEFYSYLDAWDDTHPAAESILLQTLTAIGLDLNTGRTLQLADLFKYGSDFEERINSFVFLYLIENNYDDPDGNWLKKPFQGIRSNQSFAFSLEGLRLIIDEKNDEFLSQGYPLVITVPLQLIGDELAIFDRYWQGQPPRFEQKGHKELLANALTYEIVSRQEDYQETYGILVEEGKFTGFQSSRLQAILDRELPTRLDVAAFKRQAEAAAQQQPGAYYGNLMHTASLGMNAGGYLSLIVIDNIYYADPDASQTAVRTINYDLDRDQPLTLMDLFVPGFDYTAAIHQALISVGESYKPDGTLLTAQDLKPLDENRFYFDPYGVSVAFAGQSGESFYWIANENIGWSNLALFSQSK